MIRFILKRLLISIPELFIISIIAFFLMKTVSSEYATIDEDSRYKKKTDKSRVDKLPSFYFAVKPLSFPDSLFLYENPRRIISLLYSGIKWADLNEYLQAESRILPILDPSLSSSLRQSVAKEDFTQIHGLIPDSISTLREMKIWKSKSEKLFDHTCKSTLFIPSISFYGRNNQFHHWISGFLSGDMGTSNVDNKSISTKIGEAIQWTLALSSMSLFGIFFFGFVMGEKLFLYRNKSISKVIESVLFLFDSLPSFFLGMLLIYLFASNVFSFSLNLFPTPGFIDINPSDSFFYSLKKYFSALILPVICIVIPSLAYLARLITEKFKDEFHKPYSFSSWKEGNTENIIVKKELRKNILLPLLSVLGMELPVIISGTVLIEILFNIPGMGRLMYQSIVMQDWSVIFTILVLTAVITISGKLISDILIKRVDQRIKLI